MQDKLRDNLRDELQHDLRDKLRDGLRDELRDGHLLTLRRERSRQACLASLGSLIRCAITYKRCDNDNDAARLTIRSPVRPLTDAMP